MWVYTDNFEFLDNVILKIKFIHNDICLFNTLVRYNKSREKESFIGYSKEKEELFFLMKKEGISVTVIPGSVAVIPGYIVEYTVTKEGYTIRKVLFVAEVPGYSHNFIFFGGSEVMSEELKEKIKQEGVEDNFKILTEDKKVLFDKTNVTFNWGETDKGFLEMKVPYVEIKPNTDLPKETKLIVDVGEKKILDINGLSSAKNEFYNEKMNDLYDKKQTIFYILKK